MIVLDKPEVKILVTNPKGLTREGDNLDLTCSAEGKPQWVFIQMNELQNSKYLLVHCISCYLPNTPLTFHCSIKPAVSMLYTIRRGPARGPTLQILDVTFISDFSPGQTAFEWCVWYLCC